MNLQLEDRKRRIDFRKFRGWATRLFSQMYAYDNHYSRSCRLLLWLLCSLSFTILALGVPTGIGALFDIGLFIFLGTAAMAVFTISFACVITILRIPVPRLLLASGIYTGYMVYRILHFSDVDKKTSLLLAGILIAISMLLGVYWALITSSRTSAKWKILVTVFLITTVTGYDALQSFQDSDEVPASVVTADEGEAPAPVQAADPSVPGPYPVQYFTYGSGSDRQRSEYAGGVKLVSHRVDASTYMKKWPRLRTWFWGFTPKDLPLNGRVWMPQGDGPFPLVLIVHGNHLMEQFSDAGYAYLGKLLASRGFIAISVDENFLNYSEWTGIPAQDMKMRAWMLLQHLEQLQQFDQQAGTVFYHKIDLNQVALVGHSRGGQAVAMAADNMRWFPNDQSLDSISSIHIKAVAAIAPTDTIVNGQSSTLQHVDYMTLQGAHDGDVSDFSGARQYLRTDVSDSPDTFKTSLYIAGANHTQFNTQWGDMDDSLPGGLLLNVQNIIQPEKQRKIAKVYISAFMESVFHDKEAYRRMFQDYRSGLQWLPSTRYYNRYEDGSFSALTRYEKGESRNMLRDNMKEDSTGMANWGVEQAQDRDHHNIGTAGMMLHWKTDSTYTIHLTESYMQSVPWHSLTEFVFSMSDMERDLDDDDGTEDLPQLTVSWTDQNGRASEVRLNQVMPVEVLPQTTYTIFPDLIEDHLKNGKYEEQTQPVFQTYRIPVSRILDANPHLSIDHLNEITFHFTYGPGKVMLDDIGWSVSETSLNH